MPSIFRICLPVMFGYISAGMACGAIASEIGLSLWEVILMCLFVYSGTAQFISLSMLAENATTLSILIVILIVNARFVFYSLHTRSILNKQKPLKRLLNIHLLTDESWGLIINNLKTLNEKNVFNLCLLNHIYWLLGNIVGFFLSLSFDLAAYGFDFALAALFIVFTVELFNENKSMTTLIIGLLCWLVSTQLDSNFALSIAIFSGVIILLLMQKNATAFPPQNSKQPHG